MDVLAGEVEDLLDGEASVVGHVDGSNVVQVNGQFFVREDVFQEGYLHGLNRRQVEPAFIGDEPVDFYRKTVSRRVCSWRPCSRRSSRSS